MHGILAAPVVRLLAAVFLVLSSLPLSLLAPSLSSFLPVLTPTPALAAGVTYYVSNGGNDSNTCTTPGAPCLTVFAAITKAAAGDTVSLAAGSYVDRVSIDKNLTITGAGAATTTINGNASGTVATVRPGTVVSIAGVTITNGFSVADDGGRGGGIYNAGTLTLTNSTLSANSSFKGIAEVGAPGRGGGIYNTGTLTITNSTLSANSAGSVVGINDGYGGGIYNDTSGALTVGNSTLNNNIAGGYGSGGGIYSLGTLTVSNSTFTGNFVAGLTPGGGISSAGTATITSSTFSGNRAQEGGGIANVGAMTVSGSVLGTNTAAYGGGIHNGGTLTLTNSTLSGNSALGGDGGGIYSNGTATSIIHSTLSGNSATNGGAIFNKQGTLTVTDSTITGNTAVHSSSFGDGGGIHNNTNGTVTVTASNLSGNSASAFGGGIFSAGTLTVASSTLSTNSAPDGGGISNTGTLTVTSSTLNGNSATHDGGGISNGFSILVGVIPWNSGGTLTLTNATIGVNSAGNKGGGIANSGDGTVTLTNATLSSNTAPSASGGGISNTGGATTLTNSIVGGSTGGNCSGSVTNGGNNLDDGATCGFGSANNSLSSTNPLFDSALTDNGGPTQTIALRAGSPAIDHGSASVCAQTGAGKVNNLDQRGRTRPQGGACDMGAYEAGPAYVSPSGSDTSTCGAPGTSCLTIARAMVWAGPGDTVNLAAGTYAERPTITKNLTISGAGPATTTLNGSAAGTVVTIGAGRVAGITGVTITNGAAGGGGGGGILNSGTLTVTNASLRSNTANFGGGIYNSGTLIVLRSTLSANNANYGGGIYNGSGTGTALVANATLSGNSAGNSGGGIYNSNAGALILTNATLSANAAGNSGGGAHNAGGTLAITNSIVAGSTGGNCSGSVTNGGYNLDDGATCGFGSANSSLSNTNPLLDTAGLKDNGGPTQTIALQAGSPALDHGSNAVCAATPVNNLDQRGTSRPQGSACDIGAYELTVAAPNVDLSALSLSAGTLSPAFTGSTAEYTASVANAVSSIMVTATTVDPTATLQVRVNHGSFAALASGAASSALSLSVGANPIDVKVTAAGGTPIGSYTVTVQRATASGSGYYVSTTGLDSNTCTSAELPCLTIGAAITKAAAGDTVNVAGGTYAERVTVGKSLTIMGSGAGRTTIDGSRGGTVVTVSTGAVVSIAEVAITGGLASPDGGGIKNSGTLTLTNVIVSDNAAPDGNGGGIYSNLGTLTITNSTVSGNAAYGGGGIYNNRGSFTLSNSTISGNAAGYGGGIYNDNNGTLTVANATFTFNTASTSNAGGGIRNSGALTVANATFSGNAAPNGGGGIYNSKTLTVTNSTLSSSPILSDNDSGAATTTLTNTLVAGSSGGNCSGSMVNGGYNLDDGTTCAFGETNHSQSNTNPLLDPAGPQDNGGPTQTIALLPGSPATDAGDATVCALTGAGKVNNVDQRGTVRPQGAGCDVGAYESRGFTLAVIGGGGQSATINTAFPLPLAVSVLPLGGGEPVNGGKVTFTGPASGAAATLATSPATVSGGTASVTATANGTAGGPYTVSAGMVGAATVMFSLTNVIAAGAGTTITKVGGEGQSALVGQALATPFSVTVSDVSGHPVGGVAIAWSITTAPAGATGQALSAVDATTRSDGTARATLTLGNLSGEYRVSAVATGLSGSPAVFAATGYTVAPIGLRVDPNPVLIAVNGVTSDIRITVDAGAQGVDGVQVRLHYDPTKVQVVDSDTATAGLQVTPGTALLQGLQNVVDPAAGTIDFAAGRSQDQAPPSGTFVLATVKVIGLTESTSPLQFVAVNVEAAFAGGTLPVVTTDGQAQVIGKRLVFTTQPIRGAAGFALGYQPAVLVLDALGNALSDDNTTVVTLVIATSTGAAGATLTCTETTGGAVRVTVSGGRAAFTGCKVDLPGFGYVLEAQAPGIYPGRTAPFSITLAGDTNADCRVSIVDFSLVVTNFGKNSLSPEWSDPVKAAFRADLNGDGKVDILDFSVLVAQFGHTAATCAPASDGAAHP